MMALGCTLILASSLAQLGESDTKLEHSLLRGTWSLVSMQDNGDTYSGDMIRDKLASDGRLEIGDQIIRMVSPVTGNVRTMAFRLDVNRSPKVIELIETNDETMQGIFRFEGDTLQICVRRRSDGSPPVEFAAPEGSHNLLLTLRMVPRAQAQPTETSSVQPDPKAAEAEARRRDLEDARRQAEAELEARQQKQDDARDLQVRRMLVGSWTHADPQGSVTTVLYNDGTFSSTRRWAQAANQVFQGSTTSAGTWTYARGIVTSKVTRSSDPQAVGQTLTTRVHSIGDQSVTYIDMVGRIVHGTRLR